MSEQLVLVLGTVLVILVSSMLAPAGFGAEPFQFQFSYDAGLSLRSFGSRFGPTNRGPEIIATAGMAWAVMELRLADDGKKFERRFTLQNFWGSKEQPLPRAEVTMVPIAAGGWSLSPDDEHLYATGDLSVALPYHYLRAPGTGKLTPVPAEQDQIEASSGLPLIEHLVMSPDGLAIYAIGVHTLYSFERNPKSGQLKRCQIIEDDSKGQAMPGEPVVRYHKIPGAEVVNKLRRPVDVKMSADSRFVYVVSYGERAISVFSRDTKTQKLTFIQSIYDELSTMGFWVGTRHGLTFANKCAISPDDRNLYVATLGDTVVVFTRNKETGKLVYLETICNQETAPERDPNWIPALDCCCDVCVSPDGKQVYVACLEKGAIVVFYRDAAIQGKLKYLATLDAKTAPGCRLTGIQHLSVTKDGKYLLAGSTETLINVFRRMDLK
ncbi:MAG: lactonase family protein [Planctomycetales bacterium]|nr:lactonase family protein [Planctomycetales bacterium]